MALKNRQSSYTVKDDFPSLVWLSLCVLLMVLLPARVGYTEQAGFAKDDSKVIIVIRPDRAIYALIFQSLREYSSEEITFIDFPTNNPTEDFISDKIDAHNPNALFILENKSLKAFRAYQVRASAKDIPAIVTAVGFLEQVSQGVQNISGIVYEIPAVTSFVKLRRVTKSPVRNIGVLYRKQFSPIIELNRHYTQQENINLIASELPEEPSVRDVKKGLKKLKKANIDALWVTNDSALLNPKSLLPLWLSFVRKFNKPVVVGVAALIRDELDFGNFSISPDHYGLGIQASMILDDLMNNNWKFKHRNFQLPLSVRASLNMNIFLKKKIEINKDSLYMIDQVIQ